MRIFLVLILLLGLGTVGSVGAETSNETPPNYVKIGQWTGDRFTFLNIPREMQVLHSNEILSENPLQEPMLPQMQHHGQCI